VSFARTVSSHGCAQLPPARLDESSLVYHRAFRAGDRVVEVAMRGENGALLAATSARLSKRERDRLTASIARMFRLDADLSPFYRAIAGDEMLAWAAGGAGRMLASPSMFEDVIKTICTTNCAWSATIRMTKALVSLGDGAFPEPHLMAETADAWYRDVARMGYRGPYVKTIARDVVGGTLDLEGLLSSRRSDEDVEATLLAMPGIGPYAAAHIMQLLGRHHRLVLDSWTRPTYLRLAKRKRAGDRTIERAFRRYGDYAGLAFWLYLTRDWVDESTTSSAR
jgi:N-glycosylase/DNA lyase